MGFITTTGVLLEACCARPFLVRTVFVATTAVAPPASRRIDDRLLSVRPERNEHQRGETAMPHGDFPTVTRLSTRPLPTSITETSLEGPLAL